MALFPPSMASDGQWHEQAGETYKRADGDYAREAERFLKTL
jgi:hypothetical protein